MPTRLTWPQIFTSSNEELVGNQRLRKAAQAAGDDAFSCCRMRGLPYSATEAEVMQFFARASRYPHGPRAPVTVDSLAAGVCTSIQPAPEPLPRLPLQLQAAPPTRLSSAL